MYDLHDLVCYVHWTTEDTCQVMPTRDSYYEKYRYRQSLLCSGQPCARGRAQVHGGQMRVEGGCRGFGPTQ